MNEDQTVAIDGDRIARQLNTQLLDIEKTQTRLRRVMSDRAPSNGPDPGDIETLRALATSAVAVSREARAWAKQQKDLSTKLSLQERIDLTVAFVTKLGLHDRREFLARVRAIEIPYGAPKADDAQ